jgi:hypothetical protein
MRVEIRSAQRKKQLPALKAAGVGADTAEVDVITEQARVEYGGSGRG